MTINYTIIKSSFTFKQSSNIKMTLFTMENVQQKSLPITILVKQKGECLKELVTIMVETYLHIY